MKIFAYLFAALVALAVAGAAQAQTKGTDVIHGTVDRVDHPNNRVYVRGDDGRTYVVDISQGHARGAARNPGEEVTVFGKRTGDLRMEGDVVADRDYLGASTAERERLRPSGWEQLRGTVQDVEGHRMRLRTDDGRIVRVDLSALPDRREEMINHLRNGAVVTVIGEGDSRSDRFVARNVRFDDRDLNRRAWGGGQPGLSTNAGEVQIHGKVDTIHKDNLSLRADDGRMIRVNIDPLRDNVRERVKVGQRVTVIGVFTDRDANKNEMTARTIRVDGAQSSAPAAPSGEQQVRGTVEAVSTDNLRIRAVDGRIIRVNTDPVRDDVQEKLRIGQRVTVFGVFTDKDANKNEMRARAVRVDAQSSAPAATSGEHQVRGTIDTIDKDILRLRADDGRMIRVNIDPVRDNVRERIKVGQKVTVVGVFTDKDANKNEMTARTLRVDDSPSASPATSRPRNADDCKDKRWSNYSNPSFKNQGDCVSYVNSRK